MVAICIGLAINKQVNFVYHLISPQYKPVGLVLIKYLTTGAQFFIGQIKLSNREISKQGFM